ncbi:MAG TPA: depupylase/deamidase Dop [Actinomycetota bacterium]|jgi:Pup amidohydrolase|nr:depupylase/deamidase Dop [Actinomycetota bacterium]
MALPKVCGIETEYGISVRHNVGDFNPILTSSLLINAYAKPAFKRVKWDYEEESPLRDARGFERPGADVAVEDESGLVNVILPNGARYYVDHAHPEYSSPECSNPYDAVIWDKAGERILEDSIEAASRIVPEAERVLIYKNNSDGKGNSYGCHENYLVDRETPFPALVSHLMPFFVSRQVFTGAGKVGVENGAEACDYQISQRADFFEVEVGLETTFKRPIINTRDEPHADPERYRRLHVIVGDANMSEISTFLKVGTTSLVLQMIEDDFIEDDFALAEPVKAMRTVSHDPSCKAVVELLDGRRLTAVELQWEYLNLAKKYVHENGGADVVTTVIERWENVLERLERDPMLLASQLDWVAKLQVLERYRERDDLDWNHPKLRLIDLQYHDVERGKGLYYKLLERGEVERLVTDDEVRYAVDHPPDDTRAYFRGECLRRFSDRIVAASWDSLIFDTGDDVLRKVPTMEPLRGTKERVGALFTASENVRALISNLGG